MTCKCYIIQHRWLERINWTFLPKVEGTDQKGGYADAEVAQDFTGAPGEEAKYFWQTRTNNLLLEPASIDVEPANLGHTLLEGVRTFSFYLENSRVLPFEHWKE